MPFVRVESPETGHHFDVDVEFAAAFPDKYRVIDDEQVAEPRPPVFGVAGMDGIDPAIEPPRTGKGSGDAKWREHAEFLGIGVPSDATKASIIALVDADKAARKSDLPALQLPAAISVETASNTDQKES